MDTSNIHNCLVYPVTELLTIAVRDHKYAQWEFLHMQPHLYTH